MKTNGPVRFAALLLTALLCVAAFPVHAHADSAFSVCSVCCGTGICGLCNPNNTLDTNMPAADKLGDGWIRCGFCDANGYRKCGTNTTGDGTPIGCDGSGKVECVRCHGSGVDNGNACPDCEGTGKVNCEICGGLGKYVCDACGGTHRFACKCREAGHAGKCTQCGGSGWTLIDYEGNVLEYGVIHYPRQGDVIDYGIRRRSTGSYNAEKYGTGITPSQYVDKMNGGTGVNGIGYLSINNPTPVADLTGGEATQQIIANGGHVGGSGGSSGENSSGGGNGSGGSGGESQQGNDPGPNPGPDNGNPNPGPDPDPDDNPYTRDVPDDAATVAAIGDDSVEMICLLNRLVAGNRLLSIRIMKPYLSEEETTRLSAMTEADIRNLKNELETLADGFLFTETGDPTYFDFGRDYRLPVMCDVFLELPEDAADDTRRPLCVYRVTADGWERKTNSAVDRSEGKRYLTFTYDKLGRFALTTLDENELTETAGLLTDRNGTSVSNAAGAPNGPNGSDSDPNGESGEQAAGAPNGPGSADPKGSDTPAEDGSGSSEAGGDPQNETGPAKKNAFPILPVAAVAVAVAAAVVFARRGKTK